MAKEEKLHKELQYIDIAKVLFAVGIVAIHSGVLAGTNIIDWTIMHAVLRLAVPFFFCASGYFFYRSLKKTEDVRATTKKYLKRLLIPFCFWLLANLPIIIIKYTQEGNTAIDILSKIRTGLIFYPWGAMWYVAALMVAICLVIPFYKKNKLKNAVIIGGLLYLVGLLFNTYYFVAEGTSLQRIVDAILQIASSMRNGLFEGLFFVSAGMYIGQRDHEKKTISKKKNLIILITSYLLLIAEIFLTRKLLHADDHSLFISFIIVIPSLFIFLSQLPPLRRKIDTKILRNYSSGIYFSHRFVLGIITLLLPTSSPLLYFSLTMLVVVSGLAIFYKIDNEKTNYLIK
ncbi:acyltransferase [Candidatus Saccharibacteria bacterium]|nr:acyltransferase [Candidatus Saccharibacteria bacterium]